MNKKALAILISVVMLISIMPATVLAALSENSYVGSKVDFTGYIKNGNSSATSNPTAVATHNAGVSVDYEPVTGVFGKAVDDVSVKATRITSSAEQALIEPARHITRHKVAGAGEWIDLNWEWAFGDMNVERYLNVQFYTTDETTGTKVSSFSYTGNTNIADVLRVSPDGAIRFFGMTLAKKYCFETDTWYHFDIRVKIGTDTSSKAVAYLYIDGILVGQKEINSDKDDSSTITNPRGIYRIQFVSNAVQLEGASKTKSEVTYIDNIFASVFKENKYSEYIPALRDYTITSESDNFITDGIHIALKNAVTVDELLTDISCDSAAVKSIKVSDANRVDMDDGTRIITPGCFIHIETQSGDKSNHWYRKILGVLSLSDFTLTDVPQAGQTLECNVKVLNKSDISENIGVIICVYNKNGSLKAITRKNFDASNGETANTVSLTVPDDYDETYGIKLYLTEGSGIRILDEEDIY